ncbi:carboxylesterase family protein [Sphingomonas sp. MMSM20]|uniref:carboxylesterase/lipase family protein n=1 Tax=Sphingomonas lycopersici TaxID=2951807 RepID=UPI002237E991|nr:carboxylesterase family protein [Sphingomonas lycopersici]MCW6532240.1 carboxylesterase family protein [Sphingomonas lycopersici]
MAATESGFSVDQAAPVIDIAQGRLRGVASPEGGLAFRGIPFAEADRFCPPVRADGWDGTRDATQPGPVSPQETPPGVSEMPAQSEDCLNLNVYTPAADRGRRPVLFYIHAGAFVTGSGAFHSGARLAADEDVVVVTINYRLGVLGFPPFRPNGAESPMNLGLLDQISALEWVRDNIAAFGGDPGNVTVFGYSAGGWSTAALLAMPQARGLFHRAAPQSGAFMYAMRREAQEVHAAVFLNALRLDTLDRDALIAAPIETLLKAQAVTIDQWHDRVAEDQTVELDFPFTPLNDGVTLREHPIRSICRGDYARMPVLIGTTAEELGANPMRMANEREKRSYTHESITAALAKLSSPTRAQAIWDGYAAQHPDAAETGIAGHIRGDFMYRVPAIRAAEAFDAASGQAWMYRFDIPATSDLMGGVSTHATDLLFWFGQIGESRFMNLLFGRAATPPEEAVSRTMRRDLAGFARTGQASWPRYDAVDRSTMIYDLTPHLAKDPGGAARALWDGIV